MFVLWMQKPVLLQGKPLSWTLLLNTTTPLLLSNGYEGKRPSRNISDVRAPIQGLTCSSSGRVEKPSFGGGMAGDL